MYTDFDLFAEIEVEIEAWHKSTSSLSLIDWLGMTKKEYTLYIKDSTLLKYVVASRKGQI